MPKKLKWSRYKTRTFPKLFLVLFMDLVEITAMTPETSFWGLMATFPETRLFPQMSQAVLLTGHVGDL